MRRKDREITDINQIISIIDSQDVIRLGLNTGEIPYIVPVNFAYTFNDGILNLYFHGARSGQKFDLLTSQEFCSFELDNQIRIVPDEIKGDVTTYYQSVMGKARIHTISSDDIDEAITVLMSRWPETENIKCNETILGQVQFWRLEVFDISAKQNM